MEPRKNIKRNALIAVGLIVFVMLMYKFIGGMFSEKIPTESPNEVPIVEVSPSPQPLQTVIPAEPITAPPIQQPPVTQVINSELEKKVASIEVTQQSVQSEVSSVNQQVGNVNNNVNILSSQITKLNQMIGELSTQVIKQNEEIIVLMERTKPKPIKRIIRHIQPNLPIIYYINAVIPGRAWLIGTNGSTL
ncbi:MAG: type IV secretion protein IcmG, partial [Legionella longbeachae]|nr:type IV secretion protein IcmG [Legionella longbeachae]